MTECVIIGACRTPIGSLGGCLSTFPAHKLGGIAIQGVLKRAQIDKALVEEVILGCVLTAGQGQAPARQAALTAQLDTNIPCTTLNKLCGSGMKSVMLACDQILAGSCHSVMAGGMENMSLAPFLLPHGRFGKRLGHTVVYDHMMRDGLEDAYQEGKAMGLFAEECANQYNLSRSQLDTLAKQSLHRAIKANESGHFEAEIEPVTQAGHNKKQSINKDEAPYTVNPDKISQLKPIFREGGRITAANSSAISDGAAALWLMSKANATRMHLKPLARIKGHVSFAQQPNQFTTAPIQAIRQLLNKTTWSLKEIDLFEINEAFAAVTLATIQELKIPYERVNVHGGACALGHPIGASGARILVTLLHALKIKNLKKGIAAICIGGGEATAVAIEIL